MTDFALIWLCALMLLVAIGIAAVGTYEFLSGEAEHHAWVLRMAAARDRSTALAAQAYLTDEDRAWLHSVGWEAS